MGEIDIAVAVAAAVVLFLFGLMITRAPLGRDPLPVSHRRRWPAALVAGINAIAGAAVLAASNTRFARARFTRIPNCRCGIGLMGSGVFAPARRA